MLSNASRNEKKYVRVTLCAPQMGQPLDQAMGMEEESPIAAYEEIDVTAAAADIQVQSSESKKDTVEAGDGQETARDTTAGGDQDPAYAGVDHESQRVI